MKHYRITKYNPELRNSKGSYPVDEWTFVGEIGDKFKGVLFTQEMFDKVEADYINAAVSIVKATKLDNIVITKWHEPAKDGDFSQFNAKEMSILNGIKIKDTLKLDYLPTIIKSELREKCYLDLYCPWKFYLHFGRDFYMNIGTAVPQQEVEKIAKDNNLYAEEYKSPYPHLIRQPQ